MAESRASPPSGEAAARRLLVSFGVLAALLVAGTWFLFRPGTLGSAESEATPATQRPTNTFVSRSPGPEPGPAQWELPERTWEPIRTPPTLPQEWVVLGHNPINEVSAPVISGCPEPTDITSLEQYRQAVSAQWDCLHRSFVPIYQSMDLSTTPPELVFFAGIGSRSECGWIEAPAFYCSAGNGTGLFGTEHFEMAQQWDLSINEMVNHEYGHHVQKIFGITEAKLRVDVTPDIERRAELQVICWSAILTYNNSALDFGAEEYRGWESRVEAMVSSDVHGARESLRHWGMRGLWAGSFGDCNTWLVDDQEVA